MRDHATGFSALMASQSSLNTWQVRVDGGAPEETSGRLVSGGFFDVLGVHPAIGRLFTTADDRGEPPSAVISHAYWQRRFGGRPDVIGKTLIVRDTPVSIVGVAPAAFVGETSGQQPDLWLPLRLQPRVLPGGDWLHEKPPDKVMWLHVFGRLKPGMTARASRGAGQRRLSNRPGIVLRLPSDARELLDQRLRLQPGARGASASRDELSSSLTMLLASAGVLLLITCANLANLLLARGAARAYGDRRSPVVGRKPSAPDSPARDRKSGAGHHREVRRDRRRLRDARRRSCECCRKRSRAFSWVLPSPCPCWCFVLAATLIAALVFGALPAWHIDQDRPGLTSQGQQPRHHRLGRRAALGPMAGGCCSWPCLYRCSSAPGLLARTVYNLQRPDLGFRCRASASGTGRSGRDRARHPRRDRVLRELLARIKRIPGVEAASFSQLGLFSGRLVHGHDRGAGKRCRQPRVVATRRWIAWAPTTSRHCESPSCGDVTSQTAIVPTRYKVCVVNEAFVREHFGGHDPLGMRVTTVDDGVRTTYEVVGVVGDARTQSVRDDVEPRFFVPAEQRPSQGTSRTFLIRTAAEAAVVIPAVRDATERRRCPVVEFGSRPRVHRGAHGALDRGRAHDCAVGRGIRDGRADARGHRPLRRARPMASPGARARSRSAWPWEPISRGIIAMILRETAGLVVAGLSSGGAFAYVGSRMIASRLYGVAPQDPLTLTLATGVLLLVALVAAYLPARRASRVDPMAALHQG